MSIDDDKIHETTSTYAELLRLRGYDEEYIRKALARQAKRAMKS